MRVAAVEEVLIRSAGPPCAADSVSCGRNAAITFIRPLMLRSIWRCQSSTFSSSIPEMSWTPALLNTRSALPKRSSTCRAACRTASRSVTSVAMAGVVPADERNDGAKGCRHPVVGELAVRYQALAVAGETDQTLFIYGDALASYGILRPTAYGGTRRFNRNMPVSAAGTCRVSGPWCG